MTERIVTDRNGRKHITNEPLLHPQREWVELIRGVRVEGDTVIVSVRGGNEAARALCGALIEEMNK
jgi:hypothetical protein